MYRDFRPDTFTLVNSDTFFIWLLLKHHKWIYIPSRVFFSFFIEKKFGIFFTKICQFRKKNYYYPFLKKFKIQKIPKKSKNSKKIAMGFVQKEKKKGGENFVPIKTLIPSFRQLLSLGVSHSKF